MTDTHPMSRLAPLRLHAVLADDVMTRNPVSIADELTVHEAVVFLTERRISARPGHQRGRPTGRRGQRGRHPPARPRARRSLYWLPQKDVDRELTLPTGEHLGGESFEVEVPDVTRVKDIMNPVDLRGPAADADRRSGPSARQAARPPVVRGGRGRQPGRGDHDAGHAEPAGAVRGEPSGVSRRVAHHRAAYAAGSPCTMPSPPARTHLPVIIRVLPLPVAHRFPAGRGRAGRRSITPATSGRSWPTPATPATGRTRRPARRSCASTSAMRRSRRPSSPARGARARSIQRVTSDDADEVMPPAHAKKPAVTPDQAELLNALDRRGGEVRPALGLRQAGPADVPEVKNKAGSVTRSTRSSPRGTSERLHSRRGGRQGHAHPPAVVRPDSACRRRRRKSRRSSRTLRRRRTRSSSTACSASKHFGERMAVLWLDVVRYADTGGLPQRQPPRRLAVPRLRHRRLQQRTSRSTSSRSSSSPATCCPTPTNEQRSRPATTGC